jgi:ferredoxin
METRTDRPLPRTTARGVVTAMSRQAVSWRVEVVSTCVGSGLCVATAPGQFTIVDNRSRPVGGPVREGDEAVVAAAELCPMEAIVVRDAATGKPIRRPGER